MSSVYDNKIYFGKFSDVGRLEVDLQDTNVLYIDTREEIKEDRRLDVSNIMFYPLNDKVEHEDRDVFMVFIKDLIAKVKDGVTLFVVDYSGAGQSAMIAWIVYCMTINGSHRDTKTEVNEAYLKQDVEQKWKVLGAPRYGRLRVFGAALLTKAAETHPHRYIVNFSALKELNQNKIQKRSGMVRVGRLAKRNRDSRNAYLEGFRNIYIENSSRFEFRSLCPARIRLENMTTIDRYGVLRSIKVRNIHEMIMVSQIYEEQLDENNRPNDLYFDTVQEIVTSRHIKLSHPLQRIIDGKQTIPKYYIWMGTLMSKIEFHILVFSPIYAKHVMKTKEYKSLCKIVRSGFNIQLLSYEGYDYVEYGMTLREAAFSGTHEWTHVHVLAGLLENKPVWKELFNVSNT